MEQPAIFDSILLPVSLYTTGRCLFMKDQAYRGKPLHRLLSFQYVSHYFTPVDIHTIYETSDLMNVIYTKKIHKHAKTQPVIHQKCAWFSAIQSLIPDLGHISYPFFLRNRAVRYLIRKLSTIKNKMLYFLGQSAAGHSTNLQLSKVVMILLLMFEGQEVTTYSNLSI